MKKYLIIIGVILLVILYSLLPISKNINDNIVMYSNDSVSISNTNLKIKLTSIVDSRCMKGVVCFWQGELTYNLDVSVGNKKYKYKIGSVYNKEIEINDKYIIKLVNYSEKYVVIKIKRNI